MFTRLNSKQLLDLLECEDFDEFRRRLQLLQVNEFDIQSYLKIIELDSFKPSLLTPIIEISTPIDIAWGLTSIITSGVASMAISISFLGLTGLIGAFYTYLTYHEGKDNEKKLMEFFRFSYLQWEMIAELNRRSREIEINPAPFISSSATIQRTMGIEKNVANTAILIKEIKKPTLESIDLKTYVNTINRTYDKQKSTISHVPIKGSIGVGFITSLTMFSSMYLGLNSLIYSMGFIAAAGAMTGPIGIAIAVGISVGLGAYLGYKHYLLNRNLQVIEACKKDVKLQLNHARISCTHDQLDFEFYKKHNLSYAKPKNEVQLKKSYSVPDLGSIGLSKSVTNSQPHMPHQISLKY